MAIQPATKQDGKRASVTKMLEVETELVVASDAPSSSSAAPSSSTTPVNARRRITDWKWKEKEETVPFPQCVFLLFQVV